MDSRRHDLAGAGKLPSVWSEPLVRLPERVCFSLGEAGDVLFAVDIAVERSDARSEEGQLAQGVRLLITERMWPELGEILRDNEDGEA